MGTQQEAFIARVAPVICAEAKKRGYSTCSGVIAQACIESAWGKSSLAAKHNNFFGMKAGSSWKGKVAVYKTREEYRQGKLTTITASFRHYDTIEQGIAGYFDFISSSRYANLKTAVSAQDYLQKIRADGYATSFTYVKTNMAVVSAYGLEKWDAELTKKSAPAAEKTAGKAAVPSVRTVKSAAAVRALPDTKTPVIATLSAGTKVAAVPAANGWAAVQWSDAHGNHTGWASELNLV